MRAEALSLKRIFQGAVRYVAPSYQRPYVWEHVEDEPESDRLGPFWEDVKQTVERLIAHDRLLKSAGDPERVAPMTPHFFGAVVIGEPEKGPAGIMLHEVVDGQQRLTTAQLLIAAAARACEASGHPQHASRLRRLWLQDDDVGATGDDCLKISPTRPDRATFGRIMAREASRERHKPDVISQGYEYFVTSVAEWIESIPVGSEELYFDALRDTIYDHLRFVVIELQPGDNPQGIFESLNAQGERLLAIDLVKNNVFRRARKAQMDQERLDTEVWSASFGDKWWRADAKQGRYLRPRAELFLMHWLTERTEREISATGLFVEFSRLFSPSRVEDAQVRAFIDAFVADAGIYRGFDELETGSRARLFFSRREVLDVGVIFPVTLRLWRAQEAGTVDSSQVAVALQALESWLVRRMVMRLTAKNYNRLMLDLLAAMSKHETKPVAGLVEHLRSLTNNSRWPTDVEFQEHLLTRPLYGSVNQARVRLLLEAAEARLLTPKTEKVPIPPKLTIEHVIPQTWEETWPLPADATPEAKQRRRDSMHRLGNLTLVTSSLNPALANDPWAEKRKALAEHSALRLNARLIHDHPEVFNEDRVDERGAQLADLLVAEWPGPSAGHWPHVG